MAFVECFVATPVGTLTVLDEFARQAGTRGAMPVPIGSLRFTLTARIGTGGPVRLEPPIRLSADQGSSGAFIFADEGDYSDAVRRRVPPGRYRLRVESDYYQTAEREMDWPSSASQPPILLKPAYAYPFPDTTLPRSKITLLRGTLKKVVSGEPVEGATVQLLGAPPAWSFASCRTPANGAWVIVFPAILPPSFIPTVRIVLPDGSFFDVPDVVIAPGQDNSLSQTALRGSVVSTAGNPIAGAAVTVANQAGSVRSDRDGQWYFYLSLLQPDTQARVTATAPNGRSSAQDVNIKRRATVAVPPFRIAMT